MVLEKALNDPDKRYVLIMDEYHLMPRSLKRVLLRWIADAYRRGTLVKLIAIANRSDAEDAKLFQGALEEMQRVDQRRLGPEPTLPIEQPASAVATVINAIGSYAKHIEFEILKQCTTTDNQVSGPCNTDE